MGKPLSAAWAIMACAMLWPQAAEAKLMLDARRSPVRPDGYWVMQISLVDPHLGRNAPDCPCPYIRNNPRRLGFYRSIDDGAELVANLRYYVILVCNGRMQFPAKAVSGTQATTEGICR
jgi:hypothetical protein